MRTCDNYKTVSLLNTGARLPATPRPPRTAINNQLEQQAELRRSNERIGKALQDLTAATSGNASTSQKKKLPKGLSVSWLHLFA